MGMDPIESITSFDKRRRYINAMLAKSDKLLPKDVQVLKRHKYQLQYILGLYEIIEATKNKTNFEVAFY